MSTPTTRESLLVFSDVHLGSDLNDRGHSPKRSRRVDADLVRLLRHYAGTRPKADRWRVVIAGDFIDFIGISIEPRGGMLETELTDEEREHGLGSAEDHACEKLRRVVDRHGEVFSALGEMLAQGHALTVVHGNHDVELYWPAVQRDFRAALLRFARAHDPTLDATRLDERVSFEPWFFYEAGVAYIEHGHQYDPYCASDLVMAPLSPLDPRRVMRGFTSILLRFVVRQTRGMPEHGHEHRGLGYYLSFAGRLGVRGLVRLGARFARAVRELFALRRAHFAAAFEHLRALHERRMEQLAAVRRLGADKLRALVALQAEPITRSTRGILASVLLDRLALAVGCVLLLAATVVVSAYRRPALIAAGAVLLVWLVGHLYLSRQRQVDPAVAMAARAPTLATLLPAAFVVMGHTHIPQEKSLDQHGVSARYINLGAWAEDEENDESEAAYRAPRTHLVIEVEDGAPRAELRAWSDEGPRPYEAVEKA